jgi:hypothetical protein
MNRRKSVIRHIARAQAWTWRLVSAARRIASLFNRYRMRIAMDTPLHRFNDLFAQLGLPNDEHGIRHFLSAHSPLGEAVPLPEASFWSPAQAAFLRESLLEDSDWAELVDQLSEALRRPQAAH